MKLRSATSMTLFSIHCLMWKAGGDRPSRPFVAELYDGSRKKVAILRGICEIAGSFGCSKLAAGNGTAFFLCQSQFCIHELIRINNLVHWTHGDGSISFVVGYV